MRKKIFKITSIASLVAFLGLVSSFGSNPDATISDFSLRNVNDKILSTKDYKDAKGFIIIFTCNHCPFAKLYTKRLNDLHKRYSKLNVPLLAINSMDTLVYEDESFAKMKEKAKKDGYSFPYLHDDLQTVGKTFGAEFTPVAFVIWKEDKIWKVKYKGAIDDNGENPKIANPFIANAVDELLQNKPVTKPVTEAFGCRIYYR